jgi:hypothetical protein
VSRLFILCCLMAMLGCKAHKQVIVNRKADTASTSIANNTRNKLNAIIKNQADFNTFSGKAHAKLDVNGNSNDVTLNIRISKGRKIWISITAIAGIEVARTLITPDSILVINRLQGLYLRKPFGYIYNYASRQVDYTSIEALLVGNAIPQLLNERTKLQADGDNTTLSGNLEELMYILKIGPDLKISQTDLTDPTEGQSLHVDNSEFIQAGDRIIPSQINIESVAKAKKVQANIHYIKADFDLPLEYQFNIPSRYSEAN